MRRLIAIALCFLSTLAASSLCAQNVTNAACRQEGNKIVVTYSLDKPADIELWYSTDWGKNYKGPLKRVYGDVGRNVHSGNNSIVWDVLEEVESLVGSGIVFRVVPTSVSSLPVMTAVNLGLSVKWASCNLGASRPEEYGDYYAWGETETKLDYDWDTYKWCKGSSSTMTKYSPKALYGYFSFTDNKSILDLSDDAAHVKLRSSWRMPTDAEWTELRNKCKWTWIGSGYKITGPSGKSIFLPAAGYRLGTILYASGSDGEYWSSSLNTGSPGYAWCVDFGSYEVYKVRGDRCRGFSIRPVTK